MAVKEHLRSAVEGSGGTPELTENELALLRFVLVGEFDWGAVIAARPSS
jgi:hypothetical protein